jgi:hypothetical protein
MSSCWVCCVWFRFSIKISIFLCLWTTLNTSGLSNTLRDLSLLILIYKSNTIYYIQQCYLIWSKRPSSGTSVRNLISRIHCVEIYWNLRNLQIFQLSWHSSTMSRTTCKEVFRNLWTQIGGCAIFVTTYDLTDDTANIFFAGPNFLRVYTITTFPSFYFSDQEWCKLRKLLLPAHRSGTLDVYFEVFKNNSEILVQTFMTKVGGGEFDVSPYLNLYSLDNIIGEYIKCYLRNQQSCCYIIQVFHRI